MSEIAFRTLAELDIFSCSAPWQAPVANICQPEKTGVSVEFTVAIHDLPSIIFG
ncbi:hypothetical protein CSC26_3685 [Pseudomonas aeruginosa]|nr:hypothetical protein CSC26_3681 [Pseudomonas aeruginosa]AWF03186.1 hypothetical protein CSC26_3685 [Pseudomonas aeruginosa]